MKSSTQPNKLIGKTDLKSAKPTFLQLRMDETYKHAETQITPKQLTQTLASYLFAEVKTVEICAIQTLLSSTLVELVVLLFEKLPKLSNIDLVTSVSDRDRFIHCISELGAVASVNDSRFTVRLSLAGLEVGSTNQPDWQCLIEAIDFICNCQSVSECKLECIVSGKNIYQLHDWLEFAIERGVYIVYKLEVPDGLNFEEKYHLAIFLENSISLYEKSEIQIQFYRSLIRQLMYNSSREVGCKWQLGGVTLSANGELLYCAIASQSLGLALEGIPEFLYRDNQDHLAEILQSKCSTCTQDGIIPGVREEAFQISINQFLGRFKPSIKLVKSLKVLKPLKTLKEQWAFQRSLKNLGIDRDILTASKPVLRFPCPAFRKRKVLICGWYGTETLGDKAILGGVVQGLREALGEFELHLVVLEIYISQMTVLQMPELQGCALHSVADALGMVHDMDLVVFGGGPLMAIGVMAEMLAIFQRAVAAQIPTLLAGCGVGPLGASFFNDPIKQVLLHSSYRIYRDQKSLEIARSLGVDVSRDLVAEDPAFTWLASRTEPFHGDNRSRALESPRLLLGLRDWPYHEFAAEMGTFEAERLKLRFEEELVAGLERLVEGHPTLTIIPFPMCTNHLGFDDRWFYRRLFRDRSKFKDVLDLSYLGRELSPDEAISVFQSATAALTMRFHSLIFALSNGVPSVAIDYTLGRGKVKALAEKYRVPYMGLDTISAEFIASSLSPPLAGEPSDSVAAFREQKLTFKDAVKSFVALMQTGRK